NLILGVGYSYGHDVIGRTGTPFSVFSHWLDYHGVTLSMTRTLSPAALLTIVGDVIIERGDQSNPYRYLPLFTPPVAATIPPAASPDQVARERLQAKPAEQLPLGRERYALTGRLAYRFEASTLRVEERVYLDSWGLDASTTDLRWMFDVGRRWL